MRRNGINNLAGETTYASVNLADTGSSVNAANDCIWNVCNVFVNRFEGICEVFHFGLNTGIGIQHQYFRALGFCGARQIISHHTSTLIRPRRATVRLRRNGQDECIRFGHGLNLGLQRSGLHPRFPRMYHLGLSSSSA